MNPPLGLKQRLLIKHRFHPAQTAAAIRKPLLSDTVEWMSDHGGSIESLVPDKGPYIPNNIKELIPVELEFDALNLRQAAIDLGNKMLDLIDVTRGIRIQGLDVFPDSSRGRTKMVVAAWIDAKGEPSPVMIPACWGM